jgi:hypothetical protein
MRRFNWTIVAISAGVSLGAGVAVLSTGADVPRTGGLIVPQSMPVDSVGTTPRPPDSFIPTVIDVVPVTAVGYTQPADPPPPPKPVVAPKPKAKQPVAKKPTRVVTQRSQQITDYGWSGWFADNSGWWSDGGRHSADRRGYDGGGRHAVNPYSYSSNSYGYGSYGYGGYGGGGCR